MERFRLCLLGPFQALLAGQPITGFESNKTRALLAYLAAEGGRSHPREFLAELLWPDRPQGVALANLRHTLADLRTAIADHDTPQPCLHVTHQTLQFDPACLASGAAFVDVARFGALLAGGADTCLAAGEEMVSAAEKAASEKAAPDKACAKGVAACEQAVALYSGQFLQGFALDGSPEFEAWLVLQRERWDHLAAQALARLIRHTADLGDYAQGARWAQRRLELDPWNEDVHWQLIWLLAAGGERAAALHRYEACVHMLAAEFGVEPQPATLSLAGRIRVGEGDLGAMPSAGGSCDDTRGAYRQAGRNPSGSAHNLPVAATPLIGRTRELAEIVQTLAAPGCRLLTILGPGGSGKTRLAVETAQRAAPHFGEGAWFLDLAPADGAGTLPTVLLKQLDAPESGPAGARERLLAYLAPKRMLLVLDNFEHLLEGADLVAEMLAAAPAVQILVTSRARLNLSEEWLHPLEGMELPPAPANVPLVLHGKLTARRTQAEHSAGAPADYAADYAVDYVADLPVDLPVDLEAYDATRLFLACVRRLQPGFAPQPDEAQIIAAICHRLEGMPLAIELSASWIRSLPLHTLAAEVENGLQRLETALRNVPPRHRSMAAVFDQSWRLLTEGERAILRGLSVFRGGATPEAAGAVTGAEPADLRRLVDASWLHLGRDGRYAVHELVRQYCATRLAERPAGEAEERRRRHCTWFGEFLKVQSRRMNYHQEIVAVLMADFGNLQAAWQWGVEHGQMEMARDMALSLFFISEMLGWYHFAIQAYAPIIATLTRVIDAPATPPDERSGARAVLVWLEFAQCGHCADLGLIEQSKAAAQRCHAVASSMEAGNARDEMLLLSDRLPKYALFATGAVAAVRQDTERLVGEIASSSAEFTLYGNEVGRKFWLAHSYADLARCHWHLGDSAEAETLWRQAIALREEMGEQRFCAFNLAEYGRALIKLGRVAEAIDLARRGLALSQAYGDQVGATFGRLTLGMAMAAQGQWSVAAAYLQQSFAMGRQSGHRFLHVYSAVQLGRVLLARGDTVAAQALFEEALDAVTRNDSIPYVQLAAVLNSLGMAAQAREEWDLAAQYHRQALAQAPHCPAWEVQDAWYGLAQVYVAQGDGARARALLARVAQDRATAADTRAAAGHFLEVGVLPGGGGTSWRWVLPGGGRRR